jgi:hypothetical protein
MSVTFAGNYFNNRGPIPNNDSTWTYTLDVYPGLDHTPTCDPAFFAPAIDIPQI